MRKKNNQKTIDKHIRQSFPANIDGSEEFNKANKKSKFEDFKMVEPLKNNRFLIEFPELNIPQFLFRNYEMYNDGEKMLFTTEILETINYTFNPKDFFKITEVKIEYLDPIGESVGGFTFKVKGSNFKKTGSYSDDSLQTNHFTFIIDIESIQPLYVYGE